MSQLGIISFDRISIGFTLRDLILTQVIPKRSIGFPAITKVFFGFGGVIHDLLNNL
jgi:hypothetical protein